MAKLAILSLLVVGAAKECPSEGWEQDGSGLLQVHTDDRRLEEEGKDSKWCFTTDCRSRSKWCTIGGKCCKAWALCKDHHHDDDKDKCNENLQSPKGCGDIIAGSDCVSRTPEALWKKQDLASLGLTKVTNTAQVDQVLTDIGGGLAPADFSLFGDAGYLNPGFGGVDSWEAVQFDGDNTDNAYIYGLDNYSIDLPPSATTWWSGASAFNAIGSWSDVSNSLSAICFKWYVARRCKVKSGARGILGSGAWRDTSAKHQYCTKNDFPCQLTAGEEGVSPFDVTPKNGGKIAEIQTPSADIMQFLLTVADLEDCQAAPVNMADVSLTDWSNAVTCTMTDGLSCEVPCPGCWKD